MSKTLSLSFKDQLMISSFYVDYASAERGLGPPSRVSVFFHKRETRPPLLSKLNLLLLFAKKGTTFFGWGFFQVVIELSPVFMILAVVFFFSVSK